MSIDKHPSAEVALREIVNKIRANKESSALLGLRLSDRLREDIGFDSLDLAELTVRIEDAFEVDVFADGLVSTIGEILEKIAHGRPT
jgi:acyl carrier protein